MDRVQAFFDDFFAWLPNLLGAIVILIIAYIVGKLVAAGIRRLGRAWRVDRAIDQSVVGSYKQRTAPTFSATDLMARVTFWFVMGIGILLALATLEIPLLGSAIAAVVAYIPNIIAALLILIVGVAIAGGVGAIARKLAGDTLIGRIVETGVPVIIVAIAITMALVQLQIAPIIVTATYIIVLGAVGLGLALAFGLGGRSVASDLLGRSYETAQEKMPELQEEARVVKERASEQAHEMRGKVEERVRPEAGAERRATADQDVAKAEPIEARMSPEERARLERQRSGERPRTGATSRDTLEPTWPEQEAAAEEWTEQRTIPPEEPPESGRRVA